MFRIPIALRVIAGGIVKILPVIARRRALCGRAPSAVITVIVSHALLVGIRNLGFESVAISLLQYYLQRVVVHVANRCCVLHIAESVRTKSWRGRGDSIDYGSGRVLAADQWISDRAIRLQI